MLADLKIFALAVLCSNLSWHPSYTDFLEIKLIAGDLIGGAMNNLQRTSYIINDNLPVHHYYLSSLLNLLISDGG